MTKSIMRKLKAGMTVAEKTEVFMSEPNADLTMHMRYVDLLDEFDNDICRQFRQKIYDLRIILDRKLSVSEVDELYQKYRSVATNPEKKKETMNIEYNTRADCLLDLNMSYGRFASHRLSTSLTAVLHQLDQKII